MRRKCARASAAGAVQLLSAAAWALVLAWLPRPERGSAVMWWLGVGLLAIGNTGNAADAIYHLIAYELTAPDVDSAAALLVMQRVQGPDLLLLLPSVGAFGLGILLLAVASVREGRVSRRSLWFFRAALVFVAVRAGVPDELVARGAALAVLACAVAPFIWLGASSLQRPATAASDP